MSHFFTVVLVPESTKNIEDEVTRLLSPYDENIEVSEYNTKCYCVGQIAERDAFNAAEKIRTIVDYRREFWATQIEHDDAAWQMLISEHTTIESQALINHPLKDAPNPTCAACRGTGIRKTTYNPISKWDWWVFGGRWDGEINGIGELRTDNNGFNFGDEHHQLQFNIKRVSELTEKVDCFAIITSDGKWYEEGDMGWFGIVLNIDKKWEKKVAEILSAYTDCIAVGCDLHI